MKPLFLEFTKLHDNRKILIDIRDIKIISEQEKGCLICFYSDIKVREYISDNYIEVINKLK